MASHHRRRKRHPGWLERGSRVITRFSGSNAAFVIAVALVLLWAISGPFFDYSDSWQLVINTGTTLVTFLMVFLIQRSQNKDSLALHLKLNELVASLQGPSNRLIDVENLTEEELDTLSKYYGALAQMARKENDLSKSHSIEEAEGLHKKKYARGARSVQTPPASGA